MTDGTPNRSDSSNSSIGRRDSLKVLGSTIPLVAGSSLSLGSVAAQSDTDDPDVSVREALTVARAVAEDASRKEAYNDFSAGRVERPELYYSLTREEATTDLVPTAYVFPVTDDDDHVGHITVAAQSTMPPVLEYATTPAPHVNLGRVGARTDSSLSSGKQFLYQGPLSFGVSAVTKTTGELGEQFIDLERGLSYDLEIAPRINPNTGADRSEQWESVLESSDDVAAFSVAPQSSGSISGVPNWTDTGFSDWPGCSPIAAAMSLGYHETNPSRTDLIDGLNDAMDTDSDGMTWPQNIPSGIEDYDSSYSASNNYIGRPSAAKGGVNNNNPPIVSTLGDKEDGKGDTADVSPDSWDSLVGHSETVVGYEEDSSILGTDLYLDTHNTWGGTRTLLVGDYWETYMITEIEP
ncbi:C39 family peptidase [Natronolimnohabitans sp. A-GB9]|uniref:C39 family peptidase n=1 Tax=Natronolimnohabitans sp. A-GB9 TaxID=3069757 RepID=UPI0027B50A74|nr:C39 family peptidase [Natronolimnohabitans sp. A-GB9]MDQ2051326.1 C39 family peptidase [Natronolimnohabitans sp. A-GB9]